MTHTYVLMDISQAAWDEIAEKFREVDYDHVFHEQDDGRVALDMHGVATARR